MVPCISCVPSLAAFKSFSLPLFSISLLMLYFGLHFIGFNLFEDGQVCAIFWSFTNVQPLFFEYSFCLTLFSSLSSTPRIKILDLVLLSHRSLRLCSIFFFQSLFLFVDQTGKFYFHAYKFTDYSLLSPFYYEYI